jgi:hypothetical protein
MLLKDKIFFGSHNSITGNVHSIDQLCYSEQLYKLFEGKSHAFKMICETFFMNWCKCQSLSIKDQLHAGIRFFDFRVYLDDGKCLFHHEIMRVNNPNSINVFQRILSFLNNNPDEIIILRFSSVKGSDKDNIKMQKKFIKLIHKKFRQFLFPTSYDILNHSIENILKTPYRIICISDLRKKNDSFIYSPNSLETNYNEKQITVKNIIDNNLEYYKKKSSDTTIFKVFQCHKQCTLDYIKKNTLKPGYSMLNIMKDFQEKNYESLVSNIEFNNGIVTLNNSKHINKKVGDFIKEHHMFTTNKDKKDNVKKINIIQLNNVNKEHIQYIQNSLH